MSVSASGIQPLPAVQRNELMPVMLPKSGSFGVPALGRSRDACNERMDVGRCNGAFQSYYFERATGTCEPFRYSGCGGNANRFQTKEQCEELCVNRVSGVKTTGTLPPSIPESTFKHLLPISDDKIPHTSESVSKCELPKDTGPCNRFVTKWYYNKNDGTCTRFHYGGCDGTDNRFDSEQQCKNECGDFTDPCKLPKVSGPCSGKHKRYYFNRDTSRCERFEYGGCLGNSNNFLQLADCEMKCLSSEEHFNWQNLLAIQRCSLPKNDESCRSAAKRYYYDESIGECLPLFYGNCIGNENGFDNMNDCIGNCTIHSNFQDFETNAISIDGHIDHRFQSNFRRNAYAALNLHNDNFEKFSISAISNTTPITTSTASIILAESDVSIDTAVVNNMPSQENNDNDEEEELLMVHNIQGFESSFSLPELCLLPEDMGPCFGEILRWRYNSETSRCETFIYTGCGHNANYFTSEEACLRACGEYRNSDVCTMKMDRGHCELGVTKWYYNMDAGQCNVFMYTGCGGNGNRFSSKAECEHLCTSEIVFYTSNEETDICQLDRESGPCDDPVTQWYFDKREAQCLQFTYGGCRGNSNRFNSRKLCEQRCLEKTTVIRTEDGCLLPFEVGLCQDNQQLWYFDKSVGYCKIFIYSGCGGNQNRFFSEDECMNYCSVHVYKRRIQINRPELILIGYNPIPLGSATTLRCKAYGQYPIRWHKNGMNKDHSEVHITNVHQMDVADYSCSVGENAILSNTIHFDVKSNEFLI
ncbi:unnamed protein product [Onchocerca ochengi]|uniref:Kunitz/Bovine pancreatic trypsin inhibitor domain protein n=1 Tax=Onchocerca ochengi TaxID=42157 RepID=A0A182E6M5_ONCOC|nr:unnamed protein product [Onchocerca ochengi]